jgi:ATPase subunit of ABC transporter with duplicated ATPase domains
MLEVKDLKIIVNEKIIIEDLNFVLNKNDKMAIIGEEGNGKSTLIKAIYNTNDLSYAKVSGNINHKGYTLGYLEQSINENDLSISAMKYLFVDDNDYYAKINDLYKILNDLNLKDDILDVDQIKKLSGGEKVKLQLLKTLLNNPDILLLDEPTNDLDIKTLEWLEKFIINCQKPILYVSHDETLLSRTANVILHLELLDKKRSPKNTVLKSGYDEYVEQRLNAIAKQTQIAKKEKQNYRKQQIKLNEIRNKVEHQLRTISPSDPHGGQLLKKKMKSLKSQEKRFENQDLTETPDFEESINFFFEDFDVPNKKEILKLNLDKLIINNKVLSANIRLNVYGGEHIVIIGNNGVGKTTLMKEIKKALDKREDINPGYMSQDYSDILKNYKKPLDYLVITGDKDEISLIRSYMGNMKFTRDEMTGDIDNLSGGSKAKLILLKLILNKYDVLLLDEPTRNVSPLSNPVIRESLSNYGGTIISISHDRKYISEVCNKIYELTPDGLKEVDI